MTAENPPLCMLWANRRAKSRHSRGYKWWQSLRAESVRSRKYYPHDMNNDFEFIINKWMTGLWILRFINDVKELLYYVMYIKSRKKPWIWKIYQPLKQYSLMRVCTSWEGRIWVKQKTSINCSFLISAD